MKLDDFTLEELKELRADLDERIKEKEPYNPFAIPDGVVPLDIIGRKTINITIQDNAVTWIDPYEEPCMIDDFFKQEQLKPPHMRSTSCLIACPCSRHRTTC